MELKAITAVITGSTGRLGSAITKALARAGCDCLCHYHKNRAAAEKLVTEIKQLGVKAVSAKADLADPAQIENLFEQAPSSSVPRILINSAAVFSSQKLENVTADEAQKVLNLNLIAPILTSKVFAEKIKAEFPEADSPVAAIINISDVGGIRPWAGYVVYCASKAGLIGATKALAKELAPAIKVNSVAPGMVTWPENFDQAKKQRQLSFIPARRTAQPEEIAQAVISLLQNDYITGQVLNVDGGRCI